MKKFATLFLLDPVSSNAWPQQMFHRPNNKDIINMVALGLSNAAHFAAFLATLAVRSFSPALNQRPRYRSPSGSPSSPCDNVTLHQQALRRTSHGEL